MTPKQKLDSLIDLFAPEIRAAFLSAIQDIVDNAVIRAVIDAIEAGDVERAFRALGFSDAALRPLTAAIEKAFEQGGMLTGSTFPKYLNTPFGKAVFRFDVRNSRAEKWLRDHSSELITRIQDETRVNVRNVLTEGMQAGRNPRAVALDIVGRVDQSGKRTGGIVGLTNQQEFWVRSARNKIETLDSKYFDLELRDKRFDRTVAAAIKTGKPLPVDIVDKLVTRYKANALKYRGDMIGRTEAIHSLNRSEWEATKQAVETGSVSASAVVRVWDSAGDLRVRWSHKRLDGQKVGLDEMFVSPVSGAKMMFPGDSSHGAPGGEVINCRCRVRTEIDWLAGLEDENPPVPVKRAPKVANVPPAPPERDLGALARANDATAKDYVLTNGRKSKVEFLIAHNEKTGEMYEGVKGKKSSAQLTRQMLNAISDRENAVILHHNHPGSSSFSFADLSIVHRYSGAKGIWAHAHDGSSYYAEKGNRQLQQIDYKNVQKSIQEQIQRLVNQRLVSFEDAGETFYDLISQALHRRGFIRYQATHSEKKQAALDRIAEYTNKILSEFDPL